MAAWGGAVVAYSDDARDLGEGESGCLCGAYETQPERYRRVKWCPRAWAWIDPQKEVAAYKEAVRCGFKTQAQVVAEQGGDINELMAERQAELELADELGIALDTDPRAEQVAPLPEPPLAEVEDSEADDAEDLIEDEG